MRQSIKHASALSHLVLAVSACTGMPSADESSAQESAAVGSTATPRRPHGIYADVDITDYINRIEGGALTGNDSDFATLYEGLLENPAVSGLSLRVHWSTINPTSSDDFNWSYVDDAFQQVNTFNQLNGTSKTIQLMVIPGFNTPSWFFANHNSCDYLFNSSFSPPAGLDLGDCDYATFLGYTEGADTDTLPLPWSPDYKTHWQHLVQAMSKRYGSRQELVGVTIAGPTAASAEMFLPNKSNSTGYNGVPSEDMWNTLIGLSAYGVADEDTDAPFISEWEDTIDVYQNAFSNVTLTLIPDRGFGLPKFDGSAATSAPADPLYMPDCDYSITGHGDAGLSCAAITTILSYFQATGGGPNGDGMATQTSGLNASSPTLFASADVGLPGVNYLARLTSSASSPQAQVLGGEFCDSPFSGGSQKEGCPTYPTPCSTTGTNTMPAFTPEQAGYNVLKTFFVGTAGGSFFGDAMGSAPANYLDLFYKDIQYATENACAPAVLIQDPFTGTELSVTAQQMLNIASQSLYQIGEPSMTPPTITTKCPMNCTQTCSQDQICTGGRCVTVSTE
jgi:hypothetical protein